MKDRRRNLHQNLPYFLLPQEEELAQELPMIGLVCHSTADTVLLLELFGQLHVRDVFIVQVSTSPSSTCCAEFKINNWL